MKIQPDREELTSNMEEADKDSLKNERLGRLQYRIEYDFNHSNVSELD